MRNGEELRADLIAFVESFVEANIWVAGDVMLDEYIVGDVARISPEAPVQVVQVSESFARLGGAANVARSISRLGARVRLHGIVGTDPAGDEVIRRCGETGIDATAVGRVDQHQTIRKTRVLGLRQQLLRLDWERSEPCPESLSKSLIAKLEEGPAPTAVILSDYGKGIMTPTAIRALVDAAAKTEVPILIDPHGGDFSRYRGATILKPNLAELEEATGRRLRDSTEDELIEVVRDLLEAADVESLVLTLSERGMMVITRGEKAEIIPARPREVYDVTGAGDTVIAVLALALSVGAGLADAARIANAAAGIVIREVGAASVEKGELMAELRGRATSKAVSRLALSEQVDAWKRKGLRIVFTNGCFDLLHSGHVSLLRQAAEQGDVLVVGINSDSSVARLKGPERPLVPERERVAMLAALESVDAVTVFDEDTPLELIQHVEPDVLVKGEDYKLDEVVGREEVESQGGRVTLVPLLPEYSTSSLIDRLRRR
jgi:D-beta-D-heptose 7-phosphate kinase/D-beta-D-heptose 1-phosphate adenosyltransferase